MNGEDGGLKKKRNEFKEFKEGNEKQREKGNGNEVTRREEEKVQTDIKGRICNQPSKVITAHNKCRVII